MSILYYSMVDWKWIKQRPHFIAIYLNRLGIVTDYAYPRIIGREQFCRTGFVVNQDTDTIRKLPIRQLPKENALRPVYFLNELLRKLQFRRLIRRNAYDHVIMTHPSMVSAMPAVHSFKLVFEMMDDYAELGNVKDKVRYYRQEARICELADMIVTSSGNLKTILMQRCRVAAGKIHVIPNAFDAPSLQALPEADLKLDERLNTNRLMRMFGDETGTYRRSLVYIGTISHWLDVDSLVHYADANPKDVILLVGPVENLPDAACSRLKARTNIRFTGQIEHARVGTLIQLGSVMLIPFRVNPLIMSVDPVKMYEYIYFRKPIVCAYWPELERFSRFVSFYKDQDPDSFMKAVHEGLANPVDDERFSDFIRQNNWHVRANAYALLLAQDMLK